MGINGLKPFLRKASRLTNVAEFAGKTVAIDAYWWLHNGGLSCAKKLTLGEHTDIYVNDCMEKVNMLLSSGIKPILVFDGRHVPAKAQVEAERREERRANREKAIELLNMGKDKEARNLMKTAFDITYQMALDLIKECQKMNVDCIVAPYEADSQLAYLNINGLADVIFTEDSDLMLFGCKKVFCEMNKIGNGRLIDNKQLHHIMLTTPGNFNMDDFIHTCILAGCDYLAPVSDIKLWEARRFIIRNRSHDIHNALKRLRSYLKKKSLADTQEYRDAFTLAVIAYKYPVVYCPLRRRQVRLNPPPPSVTSEQLKHAGEETDPETAFQLALGNYHPFTLEKLHDFDPDKAEDQDIESYQRPSIWSKHKLTSTSEDSPPKKNSALKRSNVVNSPIESNRLKRIKLADREDNFECEELNQQEIGNMYEPGGSADIENCPNKEPPEIKGSPDLIKQNPILKQSSVDSPSARSSSNAESLPNDKAIVPILTKDDVWFRNNNETSPRLLNAKSFPIYELTSPSLIGGSNDNETSPSFLKADVDRVKPKHMRRKIVFPGDLETGLSNNNKTPPRLLNAKSFPIYELTSPSLIGGSNDNETSPSFLKPDVDRVKPKHMRRKIVFPGVEYFAETSETSVTNENVHGKAEDGRSRKQVDLEKKQ